MRDLKRRYQSSFFFFKDNAEVAYQNVFFDFLLKKRGGISARKAPQRIYYVKD